ncbi:MAG: hypothetical protein A4E32_01196 [Methanomassiliicoccales archaeon PtaU1.Bin124]|nr:MAG: hypothetical protein A4E32_01196 [Methanomassiliicoccales archaeon PtaU1.Bin124]
MVTTMVHTGIESWGDIKDEARNIEIETEEMSGLSREEYDMRDKRLTAEEARWEPSKSGAILFHVPGFEANAELESALTEWGRRERNLVVGILRKNDPAHVSITNAIPFDETPAIVLAGVGSPVVINKGIEVRMPCIVLNNKELLQNPEETMEFLESAYNLFGEREFVDAVANVDSDVQKLDHEEVLKDMGGFADKVCEMLDKYGTEIWLMKGTLSVGGRS